MTKKSALITGINGQDGAYLAQLLLDKGYEVHGIMRRCSLPNTSRLNPLLDDEALTLHSGDLTDTANLFRIISDTTPDEIYNLGAQSHVADSFAAPEYTANVNALGALRILEAINTLDLKDKTRYYQASTSELYGLVQEIPQKESTPFYPRSPYAVSKLYAYWITVNYREAYNIFGCNGILFNHESPMRGENFVTRKITRALARIFLGLESILYLGNLDAKRDWGHAKDYVEMQWLILQQPKPDDFVIATGKQHSVRDFVTIAASYIGITLEWEGDGLEEKGVVSEISPDVKCALEPGMTLVEIDPRHFRPAEVNTLLGDAEKAASALGWKSKITFEEMVAEMAAEDLALARDELALSHDREDELLLTL